MVWLTGFSAAIGAIRSAVRRRGVPAAWKGYKQPLSAVAGANSSCHARHQSLTDQVGRLPRGFDPQTDPSNGGSGIGLTA